MKLNEGITFALLIWNLIIFLIYGIDKFKARRDAWRIPEKYLPHKLFPYKKLLDDKDWNRHKLLSLMEIEVCPYCQRNYISSFEENDDKRITADLDHFYPKSLYPFLALSLYNFIPSCQICNSRFKGTKDTYNSVYPYEESFDDLGAKFETSKEIINNAMGMPESWGQLFTNVKAIFTNESVNYISYLFIYNSCSIIRIGLCMT